MQLFSNKWSLTTTWIALFLGSTMWLTTPLIALGDKAVPTTVIVGPKLKIHVTIQPGGAKVHRVEAGPAMNMERADNSNIRGMMEPGDIITQVNGKPIQSLDDLKDGIAVKGKVKLRVWDVQTRKEIDWLVIPVIAK